MKSSLNRSKLFDRLISLIDNLHYLGARATVDLADKQLNVVKKDYYKSYLLPLVLVFLILINFSFVLSENVNVNVRVIEDLDSQTFLIHEPAVSNDSFFSHGISYIRSFGTNVLFALGILFIILFFIIFIKFFIRLKKHKKDD